MRHKHAGHVGMAETGGFSLLELLVALSLATILAGISVLGHQAIRPSLDLSMATRQVVMDLKVARMRAVADNANHRIVFGIGSSSYQLQRKNDSSYTDDGQSAALPQGIAVIDCTAKDSAISFRPRGNAGSFGTVTIQNSHGDIRHIIVDIAGQVRVE
jgi:prepilin-type N-terminal cleavage/methylation domain-containing protein